jgi:signal peptidase I
MPVDPTTERPDLSGTAQPDPAGAEPAGVEPTGAESAGAELAGAESAGQGQPAAEQQAGRRRRKTGRKTRGGLARETLIILVAAVLLSVLLKMFVVQVYVIPSSSMENTLMVNDRVLVNKLVYHFRSIDRGDIIVFSGAGTWGDLSGQPIAPLPGNPIERYWDEALAAVGLRPDTTDYIKRVIGLPGDHVACCTDGNITVNGVQLNESSFIIPATEGGEGGQAAAPASMNTFSITVPPGRLWVMGDNRSDSEDSMYRYTVMGDSLMQSTIPENEVAGRAFFVIWPLSQFGDLPIPAVFKQSALAVSTMGAAPAAAGFGLAAPLLIWRWRRRK